MYKPFILIFLLTLVVSCNGTPKVERQGLAPQVSDKFAPKGHIESLDQMPLSTASIPQVESVSPVIIAPDDLKAEKRYSISALNVPVEDVLFQLSRDAGYELNLSSHVTGKVSLNAIKQPLESILARLSSQVDATYHLEKGLITIEVDEPRWVSYRVNYVNLKKESVDAIVMKMSVGNVGGATTTDSGSDSTQTRVVMTTENDFWSALEKNLELMARPSQPRPLSQEAAVIPALFSNPLEGASSEPISSVAPINPEVNTATVLQNVVVNKESGLVSVFATQKSQKKISSYLSDAIERSNRQVLIEATVVEVELSDQYQAGIDWTLISGNTQSTQSITGTNFSGKPSFNISFIDNFTNFNLTALQQFGDTKVLSSPRIMAVSNQTALLKVVDNEVYFTVEVNVETGTNGSGNTTTFQTTVHTVPVGFMMSLTPFVMDNDDVSINVRPTISRIINYAFDPNPSLKQQNIESRIPVIQEREMSTVLKLRNNQTAIIGGLIQDMHSNVRVGVPGLSSIPWVGDLFAYRDDKVKKNELVIFIRPIVITNPDVNYGDLNSLKPFLNTNNLNTTAPKL